MTKKGFTLAEVLITLGIIGVVAALTAPALVKNAGSAKIGPALAKFVNTFETAMETYMEDNSSTFNGTVAEVAMLTKYMIMTPYNDSYSFSDAKGTNAYKPVGNLNDDIAKMTDKILEKEANDEGIDVTDIVARVNTGGTSIFQLKDGSIMVFTTFANNGGQQGTPKGSFKGCIGEVVIDIDGNKSQNRAGKDVFAFLLDKNGTLIPVGSNMHKYLGYCGTWFVRTTGNETCSLDSTLTHNLSCTGKIADNGWKAEY